MSSIRTWVAAFLGILLVVAVFALFAYLITAAVGCHDHDGGELPPVVDCERLCDHCITAGEFHCEAGECYAEGEWGCKSIHGCECEDDEGSDDE